MSLTLQKLKDYTARADRGLHVSSESGASLTILSGVVATRSTSAAWGSLPRMPDPETVVASADRFAILSRDLVVERELDRAGMEAEVEGSAAAA